MTRSYTRSFAAGEVAPLLFGRIDLAKFQTGLQKCLNFKVTPQGPIESRTGFEYVIQAKATGAPPVLIPFVYNSVQSFVLEFGNLYLRFHTQGGTLLEAAVPITAITQANPAVFTRAAHGFSNGQWVFLSAITGMTALNGRWAIVSGATANTYQLTDLFGTLLDTSAMPAYTGAGTAARVYEIVTPYASADLFDVHYVQSADVLTLTHPTYPPRELRRLGATNWTLTAPLFAPTTATPGAPTAIAGGPGGGTATTHTYVTTALASGTLEESLASASVSASRDLTVTGNFIDVQPAAVGGAVRANIYKLDSGIYGFVGQSDGAVFRDQNIVPDKSKTPPLSANPFAVGALTGVTVTAGGTGYGDTAGGAITSISVTAGGTGYTTATVTASGGGGSGATFLAHFAGFDNHISSIDILTAGSLYVAPTITITGDGTGAAATATAAPINNPVTLAVTDASGTGAVVEPVVVGGVITGVRIVDAGRNYVAPSITVTNAAGGSGATFSVTITANDVNPQAVSYHEQRRVFAGSAGSPQKVWATRSGTESNMTYSIPTQDDDAITARITAREANAIRHLVPLGDLLALTSGGVWRISSSDGGALTPATFSEKPQSYVGAANVHPVVTGTSVLYVQGRGAHVREIGYKWETQSYQADDVSVISPHLFDSKTITQVSYSSTPYQVFWAVRSDGTLLGMTHQPEHDVKAWHQHTTPGGTFESVCAVPEGAEDAVYVAVKRHVRGADWHYIERSHSRQFATIADAFFVDAGMTYSGAAASTISGLWHLEGLSVMVLADGGVEGPFTVTNGAITLTSPASTVHIGLAYNCDAQTMPLSSEILAAFGQGLGKNIDEAALRVYQSSNVKVGPAFDKLRPYVQRTSADNYGAPPGLVSGVIRVKPTPNWQQDGSLCVRQDAPLPLTILSLTLDAAAGG